MGLLEVWVGLKAFNVSGLGLPKNTAVAIVVFGSDLPKAPPRRFMGTSEFLKKKQAPLSSSDCPEKSV